MTLTQMRHAKLWFAGSVGNWPLASYELDELHEGLDDAPLPIPALIETLMAEPLTQIEKTVAARDHAQFAHAFDAVTEGCNSCHRATNFGFNLVTRPVANPYSKQAFEPIE